MSCEYVQSLLPAWIHNELADDETSLVRLHLDSCESCRRQLTEEQELNSLLTAMPVEECSTGFSERAIQNAIEQKRPHQHHRKGFIKGFGVAMAAGLALWVVVGIAPAPKPNQELTQKDISIALHSVQKVKLAFHTANYLNGARITINLPDHVELVGYKGRRTLSWNADLKQGDNILTLPVRAEEISTGSIIAKIEHKGQIKTMVIDVGVSQPGMSMEQVELNFV